MGVAVPNHERGVYGTGLTLVDEERYSVGGAKDASRPRPFLKSGAMSCVRSLKDVQIN